MAGSYNHAVDHNGDGQLYCNEDFVQMVENLGDAYETVQEMYGMIWWLAKNIEQTRGVPASVMVEFARKYYKEGLAASPGTDGQLPDEEDETFSNGELRPRRWGREIGPITQAIRNSPFVAEPHVVEIGLVIQDDDPKRGVRLGASQRISRFHSTTEDPAQLVAQVHMLLGKLSYEIEKTLRQHLGMGDNEYEWEEFERRWNARRRAEENLRDRGLL